MGTIRVVNHLTLDGVMQGPGHADEDRRDGFERGGWAAANNDQVMLDVMTADMDRGPGSLLLGRRTYEIFAAVWPDAPNDNPFTEPINSARKYVASRTLSEPLSWHNSTLLNGDATDAVKAIDENLVILGSGELVQSLLRHDLIDEFLLPIHPLTLGSGQRLFPDGGAPVKLRLTDTRTTTTGVVIAFYEREDRP
jgi:dihydrofolate reductase